MNSKVFFGHNDVRFIYFRYKDSKYFSISVLLITVLVSFMLIAYVIIPRIENYLSIRKEVIDLRVKIKTINDNIAFMSTINRPDLDNKLTIATLALPSEKDYGLILDTIGNSALNSGVTLGDYKFVVGGNLAASGVQVSSVQPVAINMTLTVNGNINKVKRFLKLVSNNFPVSEVNSVDYSNDVSTVDLKFYYKPYPKMSYHSDELLKPLSGEESQLIGEISTWKKGSLLPQEITPIEKSSAVPLFN